LSIGRTRKRNASMYSVMGTEGIGRIAENGSISRISDYNN